MKNIHLTNAADWHATRACDAYLKGEMTLYAHHISIHDALLARIGAA